jgi:hypothetical protein
MPVGHLIDEPTVIAAWIAGASRLCAPDPHPSFMVVSAGTNATFTRERLRELNSCADAVGAERPSAVAEVLLPMRVLETNGDLATRLDAGWKYFGRGRRRHLRFSSWKHTYFERLTGHWMPRDLNLQEIKENRLRSVIEKAISWGKDVEAALYIHTDAPSDRLRPRGAPCLQYVQFRLFEENRLELFALYRAHDYLNKALGNMIGLQRLGEFVADQTGRSLVRQTVFSLHPSIGGSKQTLGGLIDSVRALPEI